ncbi:long-chain-fatty-acid--CoA ligase ACSBG2-like isoform X3 [Zalophus californianus]|uniref:long-chain-fatty-acid--CoA ligase n=1 Tax=Zalophus californianus TaxID=9704 RepID=A0A6P9ETH2_ZALCA|nr:long-chain-fatty-acid--CoA ligase ACSBG2-like isoform X3 [Zalophus californianus]
MDTEAGHSPPSTGLQLCFCERPRRPDAPQTVRREAEDTLHTMSSLKTLSLTERDHQREIKAKGHPYWTSKRDGEVHLRQEDAFTSQAPITVHDMVMNTAIKYANYIALGSKHRNGWHLLTYIEYYEECRRAAKAFLKLGLERFHSVGIMGLNSEEWAIASIGAIMAGGFSVGILSTSSPKACQVIAESSEMDIFVVDNDRQLQKIIQIQGSLKHLKAIVQYKEEIRTWLQNLYSWRGFLDLADGISENTLDQVIDSQKPNQCCALVYSLSVTGPPEGHDAQPRQHHLDHGGHGPEAVLQVPPGGAGDPSELPPSQLHGGPALRHVGLHLCRRSPLLRPAGCSEGLPDRHAAGGEAHPVPRRPVGLGQIAGQPEDRPALVDPVPEEDGPVGHVAGTQDKQEADVQTHSPLCFSLAKRLTFNRARRFLGLHHCRQYFNLGLGLSRATLDYFLSLNMPIFELYGLSESTGIHTLSRQQDFRLLSCGKSLPNTHTKTQKHNEEGIGDIYIWGRNIFMGYLNDEENTQEKIDAHGWLHTGDLGFLDTDEFLYVVGNARDIITLSSGERINPNPIEERVKRYIPIVRYVVLVGQDAPYLCALLTLKCQVNTDTGEPRNALTSEAVAFCRQLRSQSTRLSDIVYDGDPVVLEFISQGIDAANAEVPSDSAKIIKWTILRTDFSMVGGELGATTKLKRAMVARMYQAEIERLYEEADDED